MITINVNSVITAASNGLHLDTNTIKLGGSLTEATTITADVTNTLAIAGLQTGSTADDIVMADPTTGVLKRVVGSTYLTTISGIAAGGELAGTYPNPTLVNSAVIGKVLTGYVSGAGTITSSDSILSAIQKLNGNMTSLYVPYTGATSNVSLGTRLLSGAGATFNASGAAITSLATLHVRGVGNDSTTYNTWLENAAAGGAPVFAIGNGGRIWTANGGSINAWGQHPSSGISFLNGFAAYYNTGGNRFGVVDFVNSKFQFGGDGAELITDARIVIKPIGGFAYKALDVTGTSTVASLSAAGVLLLDSLSGIGTRLPSISSTGVLGEMTGTGFLKLTGSVVSFDNAAYITLASLSSTATGLTYTNTTGVFSLTAGYVIPTTTEQTNWNTAYTNRITSLTTTGSSGAATLIANVLNIPNYTISGLGGVTSTATAGYIPYMSSVTNVADSPLQRISATTLDSSANITIRKDNAGLNVVSTAVGGGSYEIGTGYTPAGKDSFYIYDNIVTSLRFIIDSSGNITSFNKNSTLYTSGFQLDNAGTMQSRWYQSGTDVIFDRISPTAFVWSQATITQLVLDTNGNIGQGSTGVSSWDGSFRLFQQEGHAAWYSSPFSNTTFLSDNLYYNGGVKYFSNGYGTRLTLNSINGEIRFDMADTGLTGAAATLTTRFNVNYDGSMQFTNTAGTKFFAYQNGQAVVLTGSGSGFSGVTYSANNTDTTGYSSFGVTNNLGVTSSLSNHGATYSATTYGAKSLASTSVLEFMNEGIIGYTAASGLSIYTTAGTQVMNFDSSGNSNVLKSLYTNGGIWSQFLISTNESWTYHDGGITRSIKEYSGTELTTGYSQRLQYANAGSANYYDTKVFSASFSTSGLSIASTVLHEYGTTVNTNVVNSGTWNIYMNAALKATFDSTKLTLTTGIQTSNPASGTAATWKLGSKVSATVALVTTDYIEIDIAGVAYKLALVS